MRVLLAGLSFATGISGLQRHAFNIVRCLLLREEIAEVHLVLGPWQRGLPQAAGLPLDHRLTIHLAEAGRGSMQRNLWYWRDLPRFAAQLRADLVHFTFPMPLDRADFGCPVVLSLHDLYPYELPGNFGYPKCIFNRMVLRQCLRQADAIACVSDATRAGLKMYAGAEVWRKAVRIYNCVERLADVSPHSPIPGWSDQNFLLGVAQHRRNKNLPALIHAFARLLLSGQLDPHAMLILVGMEGPETARLRRIAVGTGLSERIHFIHGLCEPELQWCYRHCEALVSPSLTEGFGLPVAEAILAGARVVCSDIPAHREFANGHCRFVPLCDDSGESLAAAIALALNEPKPEPAVLPELSASALAGQYVALYRSALEASRYVARLRSSPDLAGSVDAAPRTSVPVRGAK